MKALILAAGFGTRLLPYTETVPKPLFTVSGQPLIDIIIKRLHKFGCDEIFVNTHYKHVKVETFIASQKYPLPVKTIYEPKILGTGGAIKNIENYLDDSPFFVINSDILFSFDLKKIYDFHLNHTHPATLVLHDFEEFNHVAVTEDHTIIDFASIKEDSKNSFSTKLCFTGIQVIDPTILDHIPDSIFYSSIDAYRDMISSGKKIKAFIDKEGYWNDIGTPERYIEASYEIMSSIAFETAFPNYAGGMIQKNRLAGDGSDRSWYRLKSNDYSLIMVDHGIKSDDIITECDSFIAIGQHLHAQKIPVPEIYHYDAFSGLVFLEDLGDKHLQSLVQDIKSSEDIIILYKAIINGLIELSVNGIRGFKETWTYQTSEYDTEVIIEKECRYFIESFVREYLGKDLFFNDYEKEFSIIAEKALENAISGFIHRDMQSRNIMIDKGRFFFIDFQGGRRGPFQYDLASLLIDPYVQLPHDIQSQLLDYCTEILYPSSDTGKKTFMSTYSYCAVTRNLQILGAFGFLSKEKGKTYFQSYIPSAVKTLAHNLNLLETDELPKLMALVKNISLLYD